MGRPPCCDKLNVKRGLWTAEEDAKILHYVSTHGIGNWTLVPKKAGLNRCGKSCRLRWTNYLRPDLKHDSFTPQEEELIIKLHEAIGSRWSLIARQLPGRTDNDVKNYWNTKLRKKLLKMGIDPITHKPLYQMVSDYGNISKLPHAKIGISPLITKNISNLPIEKSKLWPFSETNSIFSHNHSLKLMAQLQHIKDDTFNPHLINGFSSYSSSPSNWNKFLEDQMEQEISGCFSSSTVNHLSFLQNAVPESNSSSGIDLEEIKANRKRNDQLEASSSSLSSFVEDILERDSAMRSEFPELLDESFDY